MKKAIPAAVKRLEIVISGIVERTVSAVDDLVNELRESGVNDIGIRQRILQEIESGPVLAEMRRFATARCPGFIGDMTFRFARDTLSSKQAAIDALSATRETRMEAMEREAGTAEGDEISRREAILAAYEKQGIDIAAFEGAELPEPPPDADLEDRYMWISVEDKNTCEVCAGNHGEIKTLAEWSEIGEPRSGACLGDQNCRCILAPVSSLTIEEQRAIREHGPISTSDDGE